MPYDPHKHHRRSIRLKGYDYSQAGPYFVTICVRGGQCVLGEIMDGQMHLNERGQIAVHCWQDLPNHYTHVDLDAFVVMPNHIHGIVGLTEAVIRPGDNVRAGLKPAPTPKRHGLPEIVRAFKTFSARRINKLDQTAGPFWQRNYFEHIIRNEEALNNIRQYIVGNPAGWTQDQLHPQAPANKFNEQWRRR